MKLVWTIGSQWLLFSSLVSDIHPSDVVVDGVDSPLSSSGEIKTIDVCVGRRVSKGSFCTHDTDTPGCSLSMTHSKVHVQTCECGASQNCTHA